MPSTLVTGAAGQIGSELTPRLRERHDRRSVVGSDLHEECDVSGPYESVDVTDRQQLRQVIREYNVDTVFHLAAILSATGEKRPDAAYRVNFDGLRNVLELGRELGLEKVIVPSSIAVFGPDTPPEPAESTILSPTTLYGISKVMTELMADYYGRRYDLDIRGVRLPGIISHGTLPGGGTTDYAVEAFYGAVRQGEYKYFVRPDTKLPMMYMPDAIDALVSVASSDLSDLQHQCEYNVGALSFTPRELTAEIRNHLPEFEPTYEPDERQAIADSWPDTVDDTAARRDWGWDPEYGFAAMVSDMIDNVASDLR